MVGVVKEPSQVAANQLTVRMCFFLSETPNVHHLIKRPAVHANADCLLVETILSKEKPHRYITSQEQIMAMGVFKIHIYIYIYINTYIYIIWPFLVSQRLGDANFSPT